MSKFQDATTLPISQAMRSMIQRVATGPELSKDLSEAEAELGMRLILEGTAAPVEAAIFLIALRMKRETAQENRGVLSAVRGATHRGLADVDELIDIAGLTMASMNAAQFPVSARCARCMRVVGCQPWRRLDWTQTWRHARACP